MPSGKPPAASLSYAAARGLFFRFDAERAHHLGLSCLSAAQALPGGLGLLRALHGGPDLPSLAARVTGVDFPNPLGLAAGFDKDARVFPALQALGFGSVETGTVTPRPQPGNPKPRLFRVAEHGALINRLGFNSRGARAAATSLELLHRRASGVIGVNLGKNKETSEARAVDDYLEALGVLHPFADYVTVNVSSPNTPGLRDLQTPERLRALLGAVVTACGDLSAARGGEPPPVWVKLAPDLGPGDLESMLDAAVEAGVRAVVLTNTTVERPPEIARSPHGEEIGGLSGRPLFERSLELVGRAYAHLDGRLAIVGVGGLEGADEAWQMVGAGASLLQVYTGFIYGGPAFPAKLLRGLAKRLRGAGFARWEEAVGHGATAEAAPA